MPLSLTCNENERILCTINPTKPGGSPATVESLNVTVASGPGAVLMVDDHSFWVRANGVAGGTSFLVEVDRDPNPGEPNLLQDTIDLNALGLLASSIGLTSSPAEVDPDIAPTP